MPKELGWDDRGALPQVLGRLMNRPLRNQGSPLLQGQRKESGSASGSFVLSWPFARRVLAPGASEKKDTIPQLRPIVAEGLVGSPVQVVLRFNIPP